MATPKDAGPIKGPATPASLLAILGGKEYRIDPQPIRATREWKTQAEPIIDKLMNIIARIPTGSDDLARLASPGSPSAGGSLMQTNIIDMLPMLRDMAREILYASDTILELVCTYSPELAADREHIEDNAYESEVVYVFAHVLKLVFPLEQLKKAFRGELTTVTPTNLPARNGNLQRVK